MHPQFQILTEIWIQSNAFFTVLQPEIEEYSKTLVTHSGHYASSSVIPLVLGGIPLA